MVTSTIENGSNVGSFEYCFLMNSTPHDNWSFNVRIPKIMPDIPGGGPRSTSESIDKSMFINDGACSPSVSSSVSTQNYLTVSRFSNISLGHKADIYGIIHTGSRFLCSFINNNISNVRITGFD